MQVTTIGVDLAKNVFQVHGITESEEVVFNRPLRRAQFLSFFEKLDPCLVGMESCSRPITGHANSLPWGTRFG